MTELAELRQRVEAVGARFRGTTEEDRKRSERLSNLLSLIEEGVARSQHEIKRLSEELARANEEKQQLQAMLQDLLAEGEATGARETVTATRELEDRIDRLVETASSISAATSSDTLEMTKDPPATVNTNEDDRTAAGPEINTEAAIRSSEEVSEDAPTAAEEVEKPVRKLDSETRETSAVIPVLTDEAAEEGEPAGVEDGEKQEPLELTQMVTEEGAVMDVNADQDSPDEKDHATVQRIFNRVNKLTGALRE
jgi:chromosome segregation ATPase